MSEDGRLASRQREASPATFVIQAINFLIVRESRTSQSGPIAAVFLIIRIAFAGAVHGRVEQIYTSEVLKVI